MQLERLAPALAPADLRNAAPVEIADLAYDTRAVGSGALFFCVRGGRFDGHDLARDAVRNYRTLRGRGHTVRKTIDCLIATFCIREQHWLLHRDRDFDPFEKFLELSVVHP